MGWLKNIIRNWSAKDLISEMESGSIRFNHDKMNKILAMGPSIVPALEHGAINHSKTVRLECIHGLGEIPIERSVCALRKVEGDPDPQIREAVRQALLHIQHLQTSHRHSSK